MSAVTQLRAEPPDGQPLALRWREAAILGSLWAAAEIVLGSFLHNAEVPLRGHIMTAIGVVLLVAGHRRWGNPGLIWRAGLIAATMKSVSPSAVVFGPMVAIAMEGFAMELATRLAPRRLAGYMLGGALAMSWTMLHRLLNWLITYGGNLVTVYSALVGWAEKQVGHLPLGLWGPLVALGILNVAVGAAAAVVGWSVASAPSLPAADAARPTSPTVKKRLPAAGAPPSLLALAALVIALPLGMFALGTLPLWGAATVVAVAVAITAWRYRPTLRRVRRPSFWVGLAVVTVAAGLAFAAGGGPKGATFWGGILIGVAMSLRAAFMTLCFAALGIELANPIIRAWMERHGAAPFLAALETAFAALPEVIAALPPARAMLLRPRRAVGSLLPHLERWLGAARQPV